MSGLLHVNPYFNLTQLNNEITTPEVMLCPPLEVCGYVKFGIGLCVLILALDVAFWDAIIWVQVMGIKRLVRSRT
uniref:Uncharacterized protein n=1 Tax=Glossina palpalis gambiensis TaxID=67801 RepID=A0A1B0B3D8_9MUSC